MSGDYWIKLYMEILDDAKMATLPDRLLRHVIDLFLIADCIWGCKRAAILGASTSSALVENYRHDRFITK